MKSILLLYIILISAIYSTGQTGAIHGFVINGIDHKPSPFMIILLEQNNKQIMGAISDTTGSFIMKPIPTGTYDLKISFVGYQLYIISGINVYSDSTLFLEINYPCPNGNNKSNKVCPYGDKNNIIPVVYGMPDKKLVRGANKGKVVIGGDIVTDCDPHWYCKTHKIKFY
jgi:hypothetical protein